jgi:pimeloyl-ACP methyl ester carboxylesterase
MTSKVEVRAQSYERFPVNLETTRIDGLSIRYARAPRQGAETLLLLSPWPESLMAFLPTWAAFGERYDVLALDLPGFGKSEGRPDIIAPEAMGSFIIKATHHFGLDRPHAVGPDVATSSVLFAAANHPDVFSSITIGSGAACYPLEVEGQLKEMIGYPSLEPLSSIDVPQLIDAVLGSLQNYRAPSFVRDDYVASYSGEGRFAESARLVRRYPHELPSLKAKLSKISAPALVIMGRHDPFVPISNGEFLAERLPTSHLEIVDTGHLVWEDAADRYSKLVLDWVETHHRC